MKKTILCILIVLLILPLGRLVTQAAPVMDEVSAKSAVLMEMETGRILYEKNAHERLPPASVTKIMTLLLGMEAIADGRLSMNDVLTCSDHAASLGGSQIWLEPGETITMDELLKCIVVVSANDASVLLAEAVAGTEGAFVQMMNQRARELGMNDTNFVNAHGLHDSEHYTSAYDIALMSREIIKHELLMNYTNIWMDKVRGGRFQLVNTNKLVRTYKGITGLKTGSTSQAKYCMSATAERDGMQVVAVLMGCDSSDIRFKTAAAMLDYAYANYTMVDITPDTQPENITVNMGKKPHVRPVPETGARVLVEKSKLSTLEKRIELISDVNAPVEAGQKLGELRAYSDGELVATVPLVAAESVERLGFWDVFTILLKRLFMIA